MHGQEAPPDRRLRLLLVGGVRSVRSSVGNALLGSDDNDAAAAFAVGAGGDLRATTTRCERRSDAAGRLTIVDTPHVPDAAPDAVDIRRRLGAAFDVSDEYDAILLTLRLDVRMTQGQELLVEALAKAFGERRFFATTTVVCTHADSVENDAEKLEASLRLLREHRPRLAAMLNRCAGGFAIIDNSSGAEQQQRRQQVQRLLDGLTASRGRSPAYTVADWSSANWPTLLRCRSLLLLLLLAALCLLAGAALYMYMYMHYTYHHPEPTPPLPPLPPSPPSPPPSLPPPPRPGCQQLAAAAPPKRRTCPTVVSEAAGGSSGRSVGQGSFGNPLFLDASFGSVLRAVGKFFVGIRFGALHFAGVSSSELTFSDVRATRISF